MTYDNWKSTDPRDAEEQLEDEGEPLCPVCSGDGRYLGGLGNRSFFRCESCGLEFSREVW